MNSLIKYYQQELVFLKKGGQIFAKRFPKIARRLGFIEGVTEDPHVERIIEAFALLTARIHQRLDEDMPELTEALLTSVAPQFLRTMPSTCIVAFERTTSANGLTKTFCYQAGEILRSRPIDGTACRFMTLYPVSVSPISLENAFITMNKDDLKWHLNMEFKTWVTSELEELSLRLYLNGPVNVVNTLYHYIASEIEEVLITQGGVEVRLNADVFKPVSFFHEEKRASTGSIISPIHTLLQDYFFFPQKFHFIDLQLPPSLDLKGEKNFKVDVGFKHKGANKNIKAISHLIERDFFKLNATPAVNIFSQRAEPISLSEQNAEYRVIPDVRRQGEMEVHAIENVTVHKKRENDIKKSFVPPLFGMRNGVNEEGNSVFWQCSRRRADDQASEAFSHFLSFSDRRMNVTPPQGEIAMVDLTCTNHVIPSRMINGHPEGDFECTLPFAGFKVTAINQPCMPITPPSESILRWQLISQFSLNHMQLNAESGAQRLRETVKLYSYGAESPLLRLMDMLLRVDTRPITARLQAHDPRTVARGISITLTFSKAISEEPEYYFLCSLMDHYLGLFAPVNSFTRVTTSIEGDCESQKTWPLRAGKLQWM